MKTLLLLIVLFFQLHLSNAQNIILIDPGHGRCNHAGDASPSNGVTYNHDTRLLTELETAVAVGVKLRNVIQNSSCNWNVHLTRENNNIGSWMEIGDRRALSNTLGADLFLSIHTNAGPSSAKGAETFWCQFSQPGSQTFGESLQAIYVNAVSVFPIVDRRVVEDFTYITNSQGNFIHLGVLNGNNAIGCLNELGFGTNTAEAAILNNDTNRDLFAAAYFQALQAELNTNCGPGCDQTANVTSTNINGTTVVQNSIISTGTVPAGNNALFDAGNYIDLRTGFEAVPGSVFEGQIAGCSPFRRGTLSKKHKRLQALDQHPHRTALSAIHIYKNSKDKTLVFKKENMAVDKISIYDETKIMIDDISFIENFSVKDLEPGTYYFKFYSPTTYIEHVEKIILI